MVAALVSGRFLEDLATPRTRSKSNVLVQNHESAGVGFLPTAACVYSTTGGRWSFQSACATLCPAAGRDRPGGQEDGGLERPSSADQLSASQNTRLSCSSRCQAVCENNDTNSVRHHVVDGWHATSLEPSLRHNVTATDPACRGVMIP